MPNRILITGANGQLGRALFKFLSKIFIILPTVRMYSGNEKYFEIMDVTNKDEVASILKFFNPDILINCAAFTDVDGSEIR